MDFSHYDANSNGLDIICVAKTTKDSTAFRECQFWSKKIGQEEKKLEDDSLIADPIRGRHTADQSE